MHEGGDDRWSKILVGTDTSASADMAVQAAAVPARASDAELDVWHVSTRTPLTTPRTPEGSFVHFTEVVVNGLDVPTSVEGIASRITAAARAPAQEAARTRS